MLRPGPALVLTLTLALPAGAETRLDALVVLPDERDAGKPLAGFVNAWWQWA